MGVIGLNLYFFKRLINCFSKLTIGIRVLQSTSFMWRWQKKVLRHGGATPYLYIRIFL
jgi:hypothetical protein